MMLQGEGCAHTQQFPAEESKVGVSVLGSSHRWAPGPALPQVTGYILEHKLHSGCLHVKMLPNIQASGSGCRRCSWKPLVWACRAASPGLLPSPGSKTLWLSQRCSLIYPLTLCLCLPPPCVSLPLSVRHAPPSLLHDLTYSLNFFTKWGQNNIRLNEPIMTY